MYLHPSLMCGSKSQEDQKGQFDGRESQTEDSIHHRSVSNGMKEKHRPMQCKVRRFSMTDKKTKIGRKKKTKIERRKNLGRWPLPTRKMIMYEVRISMWKKRETIYITANNNTHTHNHARLRVCVCKDVPGINLLACWAANFDSAWAKRRAVSWFNSTNSRSLSSNWLLRTSSCSSSRVWNRKKEKEETNERPLQSMPTW